MAILPHTVEVAGGQELILYGETANLNYFLVATLTPDTADGPTVSQSPVGGMSRRQYPGDATPISVGGAQREFLYDPTRSSGSALPGKTFVLRQKEVDGSGEPERRQFTYKGRWVDLHAYLRAEAAMDLYAYNSSGARYTIPAASN